jgi:hypothetical protein
MPGTPARSETQSTESRPERDDDEQERTRAEPSAAEQAVANERAALESGEENTS